MFRLKKQSKSKMNQAKISTASLPDIVFMLLFFFMVATVIRDQTLKVQVKLPTASELQKLERRSLVSHIHIGPPTKIMEPIYGNKPCIQLNDVIAQNISEIETFILNERKDVPEKLQSKMTTALKIDASTKMKIVNEVKQELRSLNALKINYASIKSSL